MQAPEITLQYLFANIANNMSSKHFTADKYKQSCGITFIT